MPHMDTLVLSVFSDFLVEIDGKKILSAPFCSSQRMWP